MICNKLLFFVYINCTCFLQDVNFNMLDTTDGGLLKGTEKLFSDIFIPTLRKTNHGWGQLATPQAQAVKQEFTTALESFASDLASAHEILQEKVRNRYYFVSKCN